MEQMRLERQNYLIPWLLCDSLFLNHQRKDSKVMKLIQSRFVSPSLQDRNQASLRLFFLHKDARYRYGFEVTSEKVIAEWLFYKPESREYQIFYRDTLDKTLETHQKKLFRKGILLESENMVRDNALMLSVAAQFNDEICSTVIQWFTHNLSVLSSIREYGYKGYTMAMNDKESFHKKIMQLLNQADLSIQDIHSKVLDLDAMGEDIPVVVKEQLVQKSKKEKESKSILNVKQCTTCMIETTKSLVRRSSLWMRMSRTVHKSSSTLQDLFLTPLRKEKPYSSMSLMHVSIQILY